MAAQVVSFHCILKNRFGQVISHTTNRDVLTSTGEVCGQSAGQSMNQFIQLKALSAALESLKPGEKRTISIPAAEAYGFYNPNLSFTRTREELHGGEDLKLGEVVQYQREGGPGLYRVTEANSISVSLDGNHPLAGQDLVFEIEATDARAAVPEELIGKFGETVSYLN